MVSRERYANDRKSGYGIFSWPDSRRRPGSTDIDIESDIRRASFPSFLYHFYIISIWYSQKWSYCLIQYWSLFIHLYLIIYLRYLYVWRMIIISTSHITAPVLSTTWWNEPSHAILNLLNLLYFIILFLHFTTFRIWVFSNFCRSACHLGWICHVLCRVTLAIGTKARGKMANNMDRGAITTWTLGWSDVCLDTSDQSKKHNGCLYNY